MHTIVIDCAGVADSAGDQLLAQGAWPGLDRWLRLAEPRGGERRDAACLLTPAERWLGRALGLGEDPATLPWGALGAFGAGVEPGSACWALAAPVQLLLGHDSVSLADPAGLQLQRDEAAALLQAVQPLLDESGWRVVVDDPQHWLLSHADLAGVETADASRAVGRNAADWMPSGLAARPWRRLLTEIQMVWQHHPVNEARAAQGRPQANSLWLHGCGAMPAALHQAFQVEPSVAAATAWWRAASAGLARWPAAADANSLRVLQPMASRGVDPDHQRAALSALDAQAAKVIAATLREQPRLRLVLAAEHGWIELELDRSRRWRFWRRADTAAALARI